MPSDPFCPERACQEAQDQAFRQVIKLREAIAEMRQLPGRVEGMLWSEIAVFILFNTDISQFLIGVI
jgi:hypothetical protein